MNNARFYEMSKKHSSNKKGRYEVVVLNDDVNTFEWVIECLETYCQHDSLQAEQCATIVHYTGKCIIKIGSFEKLKPICETLLEKGLTVEIQ